MIIHDFPQGSAEWLNARLGVVTASNMGRVVTDAGKLRKAKKGDGLAQGAESYMHELLAEWLLGMPVHADANQFMQRGTDMEEEAAAWYSWEYDVPLTKTGFITTDCGQVGASPDRLCGDAGLVEIKCPSAVQHVANLLEMTTEYNAQVQTQLYVTGRDYCDLLSYSPTIPSVVKRIERDAEFQSNLHDALFDEGGFLHWLQASKAILQHCNAATPPCSVNGMEGKPCGSRQGVKDVDGVWMCGACQESMQEIFS